MGSKLSNDLKVTALWAFVVLLMATLATYIYNINVYFKLLTYILLVTSMIILVWRLVVDKNLKSLPLIFSIISAIMLTIAYTKSTFPNESLLSTLAYVNTSVILVCGIIFALRSWQPVEYRGDVIHISVWLIAAILFSFISVEAAYINTTGLLLTGVLGTNISVFLLFLSISLILSEGNNNTKESKHTGTKRQRVSKTKHLISYQNIANFISNFGASLISGLILVIIAAIVLPPYIASQINPQPVIEINEFIGASVTSLLITNTGDVPMKYLSLQLSTPGIVDNSTRRFNSINFRLFGGPAVNGLNVFAEDILPGDAGYVDMYFHNRTNVSIQKMSSDASSGLLCVIQSQVPANTSQSPCKQITCNRGACTIHV